jgi:predicted nuclease with TOPRIM domain
MDDADAGEMPQVLVEEFLEREEGTRALLDELEKQRLEGKDETVRERVRAFAESNGSVFYTVALSLSGSKQFYGDVEAQLGVEAADRLRDLGETYATLAEPFGVVRTEHTHDRRNPVTGLRATTTYRSEEEVPIVEYAPQSGDVELFEGRGSPEEVLQFASYLVQSTTDSLDSALDRDYSVNTEELGSLIDRQEELESELGRLRDQIDELRRKPVGNE